MSGIAKKCSESRGTSNHLESDLSLFPSNLVHQSLHPPTYLLREVITGNENRLSAYSLFSSREVWTSRSQSTPSQLLGSSQGKMGEWGYLQ